MKTRLLGIVAVVIFGCSSLFGQDTTLASVDSFPDLQYLAPDGWKDPVGDGSNDGPDLYMQGSGDFLSPRFYLMSGVTYTVQSDADLQQASDSVLLALTQYGDEKHPPVKWLDTTEGSGTLTATFSVSENGYYFFRLQNRLGSYKKVWIKNFSLTASETEFLNNPVPEFYTLIDSAHSSSGWSSADQFASFGSPMDLTIERNSHAYSPKMTYSPDVNYRMELQIHNENDGNDSTWVYLSTTPDPAGADKMLLIDNIRGYYHLDFTVSSEKEYYLFIDVRNMSSQYNTIDYSVVKMFADSLVESTPDTTLIDSIGEVNGWTGSNNTTINYDELQMEKGSEGYSPQVALVKGLKHSLTYDLNLADTISVYLARTPSKNHIVDTLRTTDSDGPAEDKIEVDETGRYYIVYDMQHSYSDSYVRNLDLTVDSVAYHDSLMADQMGPAAQFSPYDGATDISIDTTLMITFDETIYENDGSWITNVSSMITLKEGSATGTDVNFTATMNSDKDSIWVTPSSDLAGGTDYYMNVDTVMDAFGQKTIPAGATFTTETSTAITNNQWDDGVSMGPNPATDQLLIKAESGATIRLINPLGKTIDRYTASSDQIQVDVSDIQSNLIIVQIETKTEMVTQKILLK